MCVKSTYHHHWAISEKKERKKSTHKWHICLFITFCTMITEINVLNILNVCFQCLTSHFPESHNSVILEYQNYLNLAKYHHRDSCWKRNTMFMVFAVAWLYFVIHPQLHLCDSHQQNDSHERKTLIQSDHIEKGKCLAGKVFNGSVMFVLKRRCQLGFPPRIRLFVCL